MCAFEINPFSEKMENRGRERAVIIMKANAHVYFYVETMPYHFFGSDNANEYLRQRSNSELLAASFRFAQAKLLPCSLFSLLIYGYNYVLGDLFTGRYH